MKTSAEISISDAVRAEFRKLTDKQRASFLKKSAHDAPRSTREVLRKSRIPCSFQLERIEKWMHAEQQKRIEDALLAPENEILFSKLLSAFFLDSHPVLNQRLLELIYPDQGCPPTFDAGLDLIQTEFSKDPFVSLFVVSTRWVCKDAMKAHAKFFAEQGDVSKPVMEPARQTLSFSSLDSFLDGVEAHITALRELQPKELEIANTNLAQATQSVKNHTEGICALAAEIGEPKPTWNTRVEFTCTWKRLSEIADKRHVELEQSNVFKAELVRLLETVDVRHRQPQLKAELSALARRAAAEIHECANAITLVVAGGLPDAQQWMKWAWQHEGTSLEALQSTIHPVSPALAKFVGQAEWGQLAWSTSVALVASNLTTQPPTVSAPTAPLVQREDEDIAESEPNLGRATEMPEQAVSAPTATKDVPVPKHLSPSAADDSERRQASLGAQSSESVEPSPRPTDTSLHIAIDSTLNRPLPPVSLQSGQPPDGCCEAVPVTPGDPVATAVWQLAREGRWGLASHLAALDDTGTLPPSSVFRAVAIGLRVNYEVSPTSQFLAEVFNTQHLNLEQLPIGVQRATRLMLASASLRPALLAPMAGAVGCLARLHFREKLRLPHLDGIVTAVADFSTRGQPLVPEALQGSHRGEDWKQQSEGVRAEIREWVTKAPNYGFSYAPAAKIWRRWTGPGGSLRNLALQTAQAAPQDSPRLRDEWKPWIENGHEMVRVSFKEINPRKTIEGVARGKLLANIGEVVELAQRVLALLAQSPERRVEYRQEQAHQLDGAFQTHLAGAQQELQELTKHSGTDGLGVAASLCAVALADAARLIKGELPVPGGSEPGPIWLIDGELLRDSKQRFDEKGKLLLPGLADRETLLALAATPPDWRATWEQCISSGNHAATAGLLEVLRWECPAGLDISEFVGARERALEDCRTQTKRQAEGTRRLLDEFVRLGLCREKDYNDWSAQVESVCKDCECAIDFTALRARLVALGDELQQQREAAASGLQRRLDAAHLVSREDRERIASVLATGDIHTAHEYLELADQGRPLPEPAQPNLLFQSFFGDQGWLTRAQDVISEVGFAELAQAARSGGSWHGLDFQMLSLEQRERAVTQLQLWFNLERQRQVDDVQAQQLAEAFGLSAKKLDRAFSITGNITRRSFEISTDIMADRSQVLVPSFGSEAAGRYRLHLVWGEVEAEELVSACRAEAHDTAAQVMVCFRPLNSRERRELAEEARSKMFKGIVVDRALFIFLCAQPTSRLATLLRCALPFARVEPYSVSAGAVPPEMFFGRARELASLAEPRGSCFVYGGRQLGKTALLRKLESSFHRPVEGRGAIYIDLKTELFSRGRPMDDLWNLLVIRLKDAGVFDEKVSTSAGQEALFKHIRSWLATNQHRRLLVLLDEADSFLEEDGKEAERSEPFPRVQRLKGLMDETHHRFKVVFAGLHNVQRTTRLPNQPLAHLGEAICIGPMLEEAESRAARELVEQPLAHAGYQFESPDAVSRILALSNYYPSLIQLFCFHLLRDLRDNHVRHFPNRQSTPPCRITGQHVQAAYTGRVRKEIHEKFGLTLDLDPRYKLIAYLLAFYHLTQSGSEGVQFREIRAEAASYWPAGFADLRTDDEFRMLLEEMIGLGILRQVGSSNHFALRSPNVLMLLGTEDEIVRRLESAKDWEPAVKYEADKFRRVLDEKPKLLLSPLTAQQESEVKTSENRVVLICGLPAAGIEYIPLALETLFGKANTITSSDFSGASAFEEALRNLGRPSGTNTAFVVPAAISWDESWIAAACQRIAQLASKSAFLSVVFVANPARLEKLTIGIEGAGEPKVREIWLRPWHDIAVRQWLHDLSIPAERTLLNKVRDTTGYWPSLLSELKGTDPAVLEHSCDELRDTLASDSIRPSFDSMFGLDEEPSDSPLRIAASLKRFTLDEICEYANAGEGSARQGVASRLAWAERLGLVNLGDGSTFIFDPVAVSLLNAKPAP